MRVRRYIAAPVTLLLFTVGHLTAEFTTKTASGNISSKPLVTIEFVDIRPGSFLMGSTKGGSDERPVHQVTITKSFQMAKYEITQIQWEEVMETTIRQQRDKTGNSTYDIPSEGADYPMYYVSWNETQEFIKRLNAMTDGYAYRLPTEAEWEYAARAGETGDSIGNLDSLAWYSKNSGGRPHEVGTKLPNEWGLYDTQGNVWEWVADRYGAYRARDLLDPRGATSGTERVLRGGCYDGADIGVRKTYRLHDSPTIHHIYYGFRLVRESSSNVKSSQVRDADLLATRPSQIETEKAKITSYLKENEVFCKNQEVTISVDSTKISPSKSGFIGSCRFGGGPSILFEKTPTGIRKLLSVDTGMNGYLYPEKTLSNGYYDMSHSERSGNEIYVTTYRWNGSRYVAQKGRRVR